MKIRKILICMIMLCSVFFVSCGNKAQTTDNRIQDIQSEETQEEIEAFKPPEDIIKNAKISVTGDLMVHSWQYNEAYDKETKTYDFNHNFEVIKKYFEDSDLVMGNLETVFAGEDVGISDYPNFNTPDSFATALKNAGFNLLTTANNHSMDKGQKGLLRTLDILDENGIEHFGTYRTQEERDTILVKDVNGIKMAFVSFSYGTNGIPVKEDFNINLISEELIKADIKKAKELADFVVVMPHMGNEYELYVRDIFKNWVDMMFDSGADIVLASHPHVLQPMEYRKIVDENGEERLGFVIYSMGNAISSQTTPPRNAGVVLEIDVKQVNDEKPYIDSVLAIPTWTQFRNINNVDDFKIWSVYDLLKLSNEELAKTIRSKDIARVKEIQLESTQMLLGYQVGLDSIQEKYVFEKTEENIK